MTTENVAILFTDVVGSTELASSLSPETADEVRRGHFSILRQAIAEAGGTEVKNLGDGLMVAFSSASAALSCAVSMQQGVERDNRNRAQPVGLRVGLSGGEVSREDDDYFGDPVVEASRLCAACESGQVLAAEWVRLTAGRRSRHECRSIGPLALKGLPDPVDTVEVTWEPLGGPDSRAIVPLPGRLAERPAVGVVGREAEIATTSSAYQRVAAGDGREVLLISGEAGLGKTTLVAETARTAFDAGACVLFGHCEEDLATPYQLFAEALGHYVTHAGEEQLVAHVEVYGSELLRLVPALASRLPGLPASKATDTDTERYLLFAAVTGLLEMVSLHQPVVLVLDDLQWADRASLQLLHHLLSSEQVTRLLVLGTFRDTELSRSHPFLETLAALHRERAVSRVELAGLDDAGVVALMGATAIHGLDDAAVGLAQALYRETDGNPFFVSEVLSHLAETGAISKDSSGRLVAAASLDETVLPDSVREVIGARVGRLGEESGRVLSVAAVIGRDFDLDVLARATKTSEDALLDILDAAAAVALVRELPDTGRYNFAHALIQHTLYEDLGPNRRARVHRVVAEALEDLCGDRPGTRVGELARHWFRAGQPIDFAKAISYSRQAGDAALAALAPVEALRYYAQALDLAAQTDSLDPAFGLDLAIGLGTAQRQTGEPAFRDTLLDVARRAVALGDTERLVAALLAGDRGFATNVGVIDADKVEILEIALERLPADHPYRALVLATLCQELTYGSTLDRREALADEAIAMALATGDDAVIVRVLNLVCFPLLVPPLLGQSLARTADALTRAQKIGDPVLLHWAASWRALAASRAGDIDEMDRLHEMNRLLAEQLDQPMLHWWHSYIRALRELIAGNFEAAEKLATEALQLGTDSGQPDAARFFGAQILNVNHQRGTAAEMIPVIEQLAADAPELAPGVAAALVLANVEADRIDDARRLLGDFAAVDFELPLDPLWLSGMVSYAGAAVACRDPKYAGPLFDRLAPWADQFTTTGLTSEGHVSHFLGGLATVLGRYEEADSYFTQAAAFNDRTGAKFFAAATNLSWALMLAERRGPGDLEKARDLLTNAQSSAASHGYANVERRAAEALEHLD